MTNKRNNSKEDVGRGSSNKKSRKTLANSGQPQDPSLAGTSSSTGVAKTVKKSVDVEAGSLNKKSMEALANSGSPAPQPLAGTSSSTGIGEGVKTSVDVEGGSLNTESSEDLANSVQPGSPTLADTTPSSRGALGLKSSMHGNIYQLKLLMLSLIRAIGAKLKFQLATERSDLADKFDDVIFLDEGSNVYRYVQAKHKQDDNQKITERKLRNQTDGEFSLLKYFSSYCVILSKGDNIQDCIICSNIGFDATVVDKNKNMKFIAVKTEDKIFHFESDKGPYRYKIEIDKKCTVWKDFLEECRKVKLDPGTNEERNATDVEIDGFFDKLVFVKTPNEVELGNILTHEVGTYYKLIEADFQSDFILRNMLDWFKLKNSDFWTSEQGEDILKQGKQKLTSLRMTSVSINYEIALHATIEFNEDAIMEMTGKLKKLSNSSKAIERIKTAFPKFTAVKVSAALKEKIKPYEDKHMLTSAQNLKETFASDENAFKSKTCQLFVVVCESGLAEPDSYYKNLFGDTGTSLPKKKVIIIHRDDGTPDELKFTDLSKKCQDKILAKEVSFQGTLRTVLHLVGEANEENVIHAKAIEELLGGEKVIIP